MVQTVTAWFPEGVVALPVLLLTTPAVTEAIYLIYGDVSKFCSVMDFPLSYGRV